VNLDAHNWKYPWSPNEYAAEFTQILKRENISEVEFTNMTPFITPTFSLTFQVKDFEVTIEEETYKHIPLISELHRLVTSSLKSKLQDDSIVLYFDFPEEVKIPCEQYLLYFAQFLKDLGVKTNTALTHEAGQVLFTVTPEDKGQALDKIRTALDVYLHLPSSPVSNEQQSEIAILRLNSQLQQFQSQLSLARAENQMKDAAIQLQRITIARLTGEVVMDSLKEVTPNKDKDKEGLIGDMVSLIPIKGKGFEINLPEMFRKLRYLFKKEDEG
jgi:hypothetical protein